MIKSRAWVLCCMVMAGCASVQIPPERFAASESGVRAAEEVGASNVPKAKLHLQYAKDQIERAKELAEAGDPKAELVLARAEADAELAIALAHEEATRQEAERATEELRALQSEVK